MKYKFSLTAFRECFFDFCLPSLVLHSKLSSGSLHVGNRSSNKLSSSMYRLRPLLKRPLPLLVLAPFGFAYYSKAKVLAKDEKCRSTDAGIPVAACRTCQTAFRCLLADHKGAWNRQVNQLGLILGSYRSSNGLLSSTGIHM